MAGYKSFSRKLKSRNNRMTNFLYDIFCVTVWEKNGQNNFQEAVHYFKGRKHAQGREDSTHHSCNSQFITH